jgi:arylsulfatase A-like enzyme
VDIAPTILALAGDAVQLGEGRSLLPLPPRQGDAAGKEVSDLAMNKHRGDSVSLRRGGWKYVVHAPTEHPRVAPRPSEELFDLASDPEEQTNRPHRTVGRVRSWDRSGSEARQSLRETSPAVPETRIHLGEDDLERLRALVTW